MGRHGVDESQYYLESIVEHKSDDEKKTDIVPKLIENVKPTFNFEQKTASQLLEERRQRRLEYEAELKKVQEASERFRKEFEEKQRLKREEWKRKEEEEKNRKIVINVDEILKKNGDGLQESEVSDGGYMTSSSEEDSEKERERVLEIEALLDEKKN